MFGLQQYQPLVTSGIRDAEPIMRRFLTNANDLIRSVSASSLSGLRCRRSTVDALTDRLERDPNPRVRWAAALTLGHVAGPDWIEILERHLGDDQLIDGIPGQLSVAEGVRDAIFWLRERSLLRR